MRHKSTNSAGAAAIANRVGRVNVRLGCRCMSPRGGSRQASILKQIVGFVPDRTSGNGMVRPCPFPASMRSWRGGRPRQGARHVSDTNTAIAVIGIDVGKNSFHVVGYDARGAIVLRQKWSRGQVEARLA